MYCRQSPTTPPSLQWHYYPRQIAGTNLPTPKGWIALLARAHVHNLLRVITRSNPKFSSGNLTQVEGPKTPFDAKEPTAPYIIGQELNPRKLPGQQWQSNQQPSEQLRPMTIQTSASTETATVAYIMMIIMQVKFRLSTTSDRFFQT